MPVQQDSVGDAFPPHCAVLEVRVGESKQMYDALDPAPFRERNLDPKAEEYIVDNDKTAAFDVAAPSPTRLP